MLIMKCVAHEELWNGGILHRDISLNNVMLSPSSTDGDRRRGLLIDLDYAFFWRKLETDTDGEVTSGDGDVTDGGDIIGSREVTGSGSEVTVGDKTASQSPGGVLLHRTVCF